MSTVVPHTGAGGGMGGGAGRKRSFEDLGNDVHNAAAPEGGAHNGQAPVADVFLGKYVNPWEHLDHERIRKKARREGFPPIFDKIGIHIHGHTNPQPKELELMVLKHGGLIIEGKPLRRAKYIVTMGIPSNKKREWTVHRVVKPQWILDCVDAGEMLNYESYRVLDKGPLQSRLTMGLNIVKEKRMDFDDVLKGTYAPKSILTPVGQNAEKEDKAQEQQPGSQKSIRLSQKSIRLSQKITKPGISAPKNSQDKMSGQSSQKKLQEISNGSGAGNTDFQTRRTSPRLSPKQAPPPSPPAIEPPKQARNPRLSPPRRPPRPPAVEPIQQVSPFFGRAPPKKPQGEIAARSENIRLKSITPLPAKHATKQSEDGNWDDIVDKLDNEVCKEKPLGEPEYNYDGKAGDFPSSPLENVELSPTSLDPLKQPPLPQCPQPRVQPTTPKRNEHLPLTIIPSPEKIDTEVLDALPEEFQEEIYRALGKQSEQIRRSDKKEKEPSKPKVDQEGWQIPPSALLADKSGGQDEDKGPAPELERVPEGRPTPKIEGPKPLRQYDSRIDFLASDMDAIEEELNQMEKAQPLEKIVEGPRENDICSSIDNPVTPLAEPPKRWDSNESFDDFDDFDVEDFKALSQQAKARTSQELEIQDSQEEPTSSLETPPPDSPTDWEFVDRVAAESISPLSRRPVPRIAEPAPEYPTPKMPFNLPPAPSIDPSPPTPPADFSATPIASLPKFRGENTIPALRKALRFWLFDPQGRPPSEASLEEFHFYLEELHSLGEDEFGLKVLGLFTRTCEDMARRLRNGCWIWEELRERVEERGESVVGRESRVR